MIHLDETDGVSVLRIEHGKANALDVELCAALTQALGSAKDRRALVLTGTDRMFSAGVDLFRLLREGEGYATELITGLDACLIELFTFPRPVVAAVNGHAIAGGCVLVAACDRRIMTSGKAKIGITELPVGVPFPVVPLEVMRAGVPPQHMAELVYLGQTYAPTRALELGLVDALVDPEEVLPRALEAANTLARIPAATFAMTKRQLREPAMHTIERHRAIFDAEITAVWKRDETRRTIEAFLEKTVGKR